jgi:hypothetical protein
MTAVWAAEGLLRGIPYGIPATFRAGMLAKGGGDFSHERDGREEA